MTTVHVIAHTHWDREWYLTREQYRARLVDLIDRVVDRMASDPEFSTFHLDGQTVVLEDYLEVRPEREAALRALVRSGRLLVGPWYVMPDMFLVSGESIVRNLALGLRIAHDFGRAMRIGYMPDPFGHLAQMPQVLAGVGLEGAILWRGFGGPRSEYHWEAPDGSRALLLHLPREGYCNGLGLPVLPPDRMRTEAAAVVAREAVRSSRGQVLLMVGVDHVEPHPALLELVRVIDALPGTAARLSTLPAYVEATQTASVADGGPLEVIRGELRVGHDYAFLLPGVWSARTYLKQANARTQRELEHWAEPLSVFASLCGADPVPGLLGYAWKTLLQNHPHDSICGCSIDAVHDENVTRFARAQQAAEVVTSRGAREIARRLGPAPAGRVRCVALNTDTHAWSGVLETVVELPLEPARQEREVDPAQLEEPLVFFGPTASAAAVTDAHGQPLRFQVLDEQESISHRMARYLPPAAIRVRRVRLLADVRHVPALGYAAVDVHVGADRGKTVVPGARAWCDGRALENDLLRVEVRDDGAVDVLDRRTATRYSGVFGLDDGGDVGDEYTYAPPGDDLRVTSAAARAVRVCSLEHGPLRAALAVEFVMSIPAAATADRCARALARVEMPVVLEIRLSAGAPIVEGRIRLENRARDHRLRVLFPTGTAAVASHRADSAFGVVERPTAPVVPAGELVETPVAAAPMQSFVDAGDATRGATVITDGLVEYEVVPRDDGAAIEVTLLRAVGDLSRDDLSTRRGHAGPGLATPGAQCLGAHAFRVAFAPRGLPPAPKDLYAVARSVVSPPRVFSPCGGSGELPPSGSFLRVSADPDADLVLSACKRADAGEGIVLRVFNAGDRPQTIAVTSADRLDAAWRVDLAEHGVRACALTETGAEVTVGAHRIETLLLRGQGQASGARAGIMII